MIEIKAYAKVNLALNIEGKCQDRHLLDSIISPINIYDTIFLEKNDDNAVEVRYENLNNYPKNDTAFRMAALIQDKYNLSGVKISIIKNIAFGSGLGGSSADAVGVAKGMEKLFNLGELPLSLLLEVGSDVPSMYIGGDVRIKGLGEICTKVNLPKLYKIVLIEDKGVSTKASFELYDEVGGDKVDIDEFMEKLNKEEAVFVNSLEKASMMLNSKIAKNKALLDSCGFISCMTGSGSGVVGYAYSKEQFDTAYEKLKKKIDISKVILGQKE